MKKISGMPRLDDANNRVFVLGTNLYYTTSIPWQKVTSDLASITVCATLSYKIQSSIGLWTLLPTYTVFRVFESAVQHYN